MSSGFAGGIKIKIRIKFRMPKGLDNEANLILNLPPNPA